MGYNLFIDDERFPPDDGRKWVIARSSEEAISIFENQGVPDYISFDHDLGGDDTSMIYIDHLINLTLDLLSLNVEKWQIAFPRNYTVHSQNPVGARNINLKLQAFIKFLDQ